MALDQSALLELSEALRSADSGELMRRLLHTMLQALIDAEATAHIGAAPHERTATRTTQRNGTRDKLVAKLCLDTGFAARFYRALAIYLSTTVRERHRDLGSGVGGGGAPEEEDDVDELDPNVLDGVYLAGERFDRMVKRVMVS